jgi:hypothetical protein
MELVPRSPAKPTPTPTTPVDHAKALRILANALEVEEMLTRASRLVNELTVIAYRSEAKTRSLVSNKPTSIILKPLDAQRAEYILRELNELSEKCTERMRQPLDHVHKNQPPEFLAAAAYLLKADPAKAAGQVAKFEGYRAKFVKDGSKPINFLSFIPGTVAVVQAALKARQQLKAKDLNDADIAAMERRRASAEIDGVARVVKHEADVSGTIGASEANKLNTTVAAGARIGVGAGVFAAAAMKDVADDLKIRRHATPFDSLRTMRPEMV